MIDPPTPVDSNADNPFEIDDEGPVLGANIDVPNKEDPEGTDDEGPVAGAHIDVPAGKPVPSQRKVREQERKDEEAADLAIDESETESGAEKSFDIRPDFGNMDVAGIKEWFREHTNFLRKSGAVVRGPKVLAVRVDGEATATELTREAGVQPDNEVETVYEGQFAWQYGDNPEVTLRTPRPDELDSWRDLGREAMQRRNEV